MINKLLTQGRVLFVEKDCIHCKLYKQFIFGLNVDLKLNKRFLIIDCTNYDQLGVMDNQIIKTFEPYFDSYPTLFFEGEKIEGANSIEECKAWLINRLILEDDFIFPKTPEYLPTINSYCLFHLDCKHQKGRIICN